jgi:hypothetical protein
MTETSQKFQKVEYMIWLAKVFGDVISIGSGQLYVTNSDFSSNGSVLSAVFVLLQFFPSQRVL